MSWANSEFMGRGGWRGGVGATFIAAALALAAVPAQAQSPTPTPAEPAVVSEPQAEPAPVAPSEATKAESSAPGDSNPAEVKLDSVEVKPEPMSSITDMFLPSALPHDLTPWGMFRHADPLVKAVMIGLAIASLVTWTVWLAKTIELWSARRNARRGLEILAHASTLRGAEKDLGEARGPVVRFVAAAVGEMDRSAGLPQEGVKERAIALLSRIEARAGRTIDSRHWPARDNRLDGALCRPVRDGLGHHGQFHRHIEDEHDQSGRRGARHRRSLARDRHGAFRGDSRGCDL